MSARTTIFATPLLGASACAIALALCCTLLPADDAHAVTAAEKQAEADAVYAQIDSLQTNLNEAMDEYDRAQAAHDDAIAKRDEAARQIESESARIDQLQGKLSDFAVTMYKDGGSGTFLDVLLETTTFEQFLTTWDACASVSNQGVSMIDEAREARQRLYQAQNAFEAEGWRAEEEMAKAEKTKAEIEETQEALRVEAESLSAEAAELQRQEELAAEAARQAEEARKQQEAALKAAEEAAKKAAEGQQDGGENAEGDSGQADSGTSQVVVGSGYFTHPCPGATISSEFGYRTFDNSFHKGLDLAAPEGTPYYAADRGTVMYATNDGGYNGGAGNWVVIAHGNGIVTKYMHSSATYVKPGDIVERGQNIGAVGNTGNSFGAHLHFQVEVNNVAVNPLNYL